jgi:hypothetical protein
MTKHMARLWRAWGITRSELFLVNGTRTRMARHAPVIRKATPVNSRARMTEPSMWARLTTHAIVAKLRHPGTVQRPRSWARLRLRLKVDMMGLRMYRCLLVERATRAR